MQYQNNAISKQIHITVEYQNNFEWPGKIKAANYKSFINSAGIVS